MKILDKRLYAFREVMLNKFIEVEYKHPHNSVTNDNVDWNNFDWNAITNHYFEEIEEVKQMHLENRIRATPINPKEYIDVANMAFLLYWYYTIGNGNQNENR